ncbi:MAG: hypothetical protein ABSA90_11770 [Xanthobacteraceae bacterium]
MTRQQKLSEQPIAEKPSARLDELRSKEGALKVKLGTLQAEITGSEQRLEAPLATDTAETLTKIDDRLRQARVVLAIVKRDYEGAAAARAAAETEIQLAAEHQRRQNLQARVDELVSIVPPAYRRLAEEFLALVARVHDIDQEITEFNKTRTSDGDRILTFHDRIRVTPATAEHRGIYPARLSSVFEIPALQRDDHPYRVPFTYPPGQGDLWTDVTGVVRRG